MTGLGYRLVGDLPRVSFCTRVSARMKPSWAHFKLSSFHAHISHTVYIVLRTSTGDRGKTKLPVVRRCVFIKSTVLMCYDASQIKDRPGNLTCSP